MDNSLPLCIDLDGTLVRSDSLHEAFVKALKTSPVKTVLSLRWVFSSKAKFKNAISQLASLDTSTLPYNKDVLQYATQEAESRDLVLVTGANHRVAESVSEHLGIFDSVMSSDLDINLTGERKRKALVGRFGEKGFDYIGNEPTDVPVWSSANMASVVTSNAKFVSEIQSKFNVDKVFSMAAPSISTWVKFLRVHQWSKNLLILVPFFLDHRFSEWADLKVIALAFLAFSMLASLTYIVNDMLDIESDRKNTTKAKRALASGEISITHALRACGVLLVCVLVICQFLPFLFNCVLGGYSVLTLLYSSMLKKMIMMDVVVLALLHTIRIVAGTVAVEAIWSFWLLAFSMFFFLSLALAKRVSELHNVKIEKKNRPSARGYEISDIAVLSSTGIAAGNLSILVIALYINSSKVSSIYAIPEILWFICPLLLYWVGRLWIITSRGEMHEDPIVFGLRDRTSIAVLSGIALVFSIAVLV